MAIEIISKHQKKSPSWMIALFIFSLIAVLFVLGAYLYLEMSNRRLSGKIEETREALSRIPNPEQKAMEEELLLHEAKINSFSSLLSEHRKTLNIFDFLQSVSHPKVWFSDFKFDSEKNTISVSGKADSFIAVGQQIIILKGQEFLKDIILSKLSMGEKGGVDFDIQLTLNPRIYK